MIPDNFSGFLYGFLVNDTNFVFEFSDSSGTHTLQIPFGGYVTQTLGDVIEGLMNDISAVEYVVTFDHTTRFFTISGSDNFDLDVSGGSSASIFPLIGFTGPDRTGADNYTSDTEAGILYEPQFLLQDYIPTTLNRKNVDETLNETVEGQFEIVSFGEIRMMECNIRYVNDRNISIPNKLKADANGVQNTVNFMEYITQKIPVEFYEDIDNRNLFEVLTLESTRDNQNGTSYVLRERYNEGLRGYYDTGLLKFRKQVN